MDVGVAGKAWSGGTRAAGQVERFDPDLRDAITVFAAIGQFDEIIRTEAITATRP